MKPSVLHDKSYKAATYAMFLGTMLTLAFLVLFFIAVLDHVFKSKETLTSFFAKDRNQLVVENKQLQHKIDSLQAISSEVAMLRIKLKNRDNPVKSASNVVVPSIGHYNNEPLKQSNYNKYLAEKMVFYYNKSAELERFINENW